MNLLHEVKVVNWVNDNHYDNRKQPTRGGSRSERPEMFRGEVKGGTILSR